MEIFTESMNTNKLRNTVPNKIGSAAPEQTPPAFALTADDERMLREIESADPKFAELYESGDWMRHYSFREGAQEYVLMTLAEKTGMDEGRIDRLYRGSALMDAKWDEPVRKGGKLTYGNEKVDRAMEHLIRLNREIAGAPEEESVFNPVCREEGEPPFFEKPGTLRVVSMSEIEPRKAEYLIQPYLPKGRLSIVAGVSGSTKTWFILSVAAFLSRGGHFPTDGEDAPARAPAVTVYQTRENDYHTDIRPRLDAMGADMEKIVMIDESAGEGEALSFSDGRLREVCLLHHPAMIVFDPVQSYLGAQVDMHRANEVRPVLDSLIALAEEFDCAVVLVSHLSKMTTASALDRIMGSADFRNAARSILLIGSDPEDENARVAVHAKNSLGTAGESIRYHIDPAHGVVFDGLCELTEDEIISSGKRMRKKKDVPVSARAAESIRALFGGRDAVPAEEVLEMQKRERITDGTLYRLKKQFGIRTAIIGNDPAARERWWVKPEVDIEEFKLCQKARM